MESADHPPLNHQVVAFIPARPLHVDAVALGSAVPAKAKSHQVKGDIVRVDDNAACGGGQVASEIVGSGILDGVGQAGDRGAGLQLPESLHGRSRRTGGRNKVALRK